MINKIRAQDHHHRKLIVYIAVGCVTSIIGGIYFYSIFSHKGQIGNSNPSVKQTSPAKDLINSLIYVGKEASSAVKTGIEKTKLDPAQSGMTNETEVQTDSATELPQSSEQDYIQPQSTN